MIQRITLPAISVLTLLSCGSNGNIGDGGDPCAGCPDGACAADCMSAMGEWEGPVLLWQGDKADAPDCPEAAPELLSEGYADFNDSPLPCGACSCGPSLCSLPTETKAVTYESCVDSPDAVYLSVQTPDGWDGTCVTVPTIDTDEYRSMVFYGTNMSECVPQQTPPEALPPDAPWETFGRVCTTAAPLLDCDDPDRGCFQPGEPSPSSFARCVRSVTGDAPCPAAYPERRVLYAGLDDTRSCAPCTCGPQHDGVCYGAMKVYRDDACSQYHAVQYLVPSADTGCSSFISNSEIDSISGVLIDVEPGVCDPLGGEPVGEATPLDPTVYCCEAPVD